MYVLANGTAMRPMAPHRVVLSLHHRQAVRRFLPAAAELDRVSAASVRPGRQVVERIGAERNSVDRFLIVVISRISFSFSVIFIADPVGN